MTSKGAMNSMQFFVCFVTALLVTATGAMSGCRGERTAERPRQFFPGMDDQPKYKPQAESTFFADGRTMREPVAGTVPFGRRAETNDDWVAPDETRASLLRGDDRVYRGMNPDGTYVEVMPVREVLEIPSGQSVTPADMKSFIEYGQNRFNIFCITCHGGTGAGDGMVGQLWSTPIPSYHQPQYMPGGEKGQDGYIFHVIRNGLANTPGTLPELRMPAYGDRVSPRDAWAIVAYLRTLQAVQQGTMADVPEALQRELNNSRGATSAGGSTGGGAE